MKQASKNIHFLIACVGALAAFGVYHSLSGGERNQAHASLSAASVDGQGEMVNYKPARKRYLSSRLRQDVEQILDLSGHDIVQIFDAPELVRRDLPTTIWQYRNARCVMDVYFTVERVEDISKSNVAHYEVRQRDTRSEKQVKPADCMQDLIAHDTMISLIDVSAIFKAQ